MADFRSKNVKNRIETCFLCKVSTKICIRSTIRYVISRFSTEKWSLLAKKRPFLAQNGPFSVKNSRFWAKNVKNSWKFVRFFVCCNFENFLSKIDRFSWYNSVIDAKFHSEFESVVKTNVSDIHRRQKWKLLKCKKFTLFARFWPFSISYSFPPSFG